jgi:IS30 family transposase
MTGHSPATESGDLIKGAGNRSAVGVLLERSSRLVMLIKLVDSPAASVLESFTANLSSIAEPIGQTLTYDLGKDMARHAELSNNTSVKIYFCDPHSPWQRGSCENTNGLICHYMPKGTDLSIRSHVQLDSIADLLNTGPSAIRGFYQPIAVYQAMLNKISQPNTSIQ